jgi:predicted PurR-regulated permease PerM
VPIGESKRGSEGARVRGAAPARVDVRHLRAAAGWAVALFLAFYFFPAFQLVFLCLLGSAILASTLQPLAHRIPAKRWPSAVIAGLVPIAGVALLAVLLAWLLWTVLHEQAGQWPQTRAGIDQLLARWSHTLGLDTPLDVRSLQEQLTAALTGGGGKVAAVAAGAVANGIVALILVLFGAMFLLGERERTLLLPLLALLPPRRRPQVESAVLALGPKLRWWLLGALASMTATGVASGIGFLIAGIPLALPLAVMAGFSELVPTFGPTVVFLVAMLIAATTGPKAVISVLVVWAVVQTLESYVLQPTIMKRAVKVPPLITLFSVVFWGKVFGLAGLLLAIPLDLVVWSFATHLMGDRDGEAGGAATKSGAGGG